MSNAAAKVERLEEIIDAAIRNNPHSKEIINAFKPLLIEKIRLMEKLDLDGRKTPDLGESGLKNGVPLMRQNDCMPDKDACEMITLSVLPALQQGFPQISSELDKLSMGIKEGSIILPEYFALASDEGGELVDKWIAKTGISGHVLRFAARITGRIHLEKIAVTWADLIKDLPWEKGYCPICGSLPMIAKVREKIGTRLLHCSQCGHEWTFSRVICPACEGKDQKAMTYFFVDDNNKDCAFVCEKCKRYLITVNQVSDLADFNAEASALSLVHLDVLMQEKGYRPMAECEWNACS